MNCTATNLGSAVLVVASGRIDLETAEAFKNELSTALAAAPKALVIDLSAVDYISSAGLRSLMIVFKAGKAAGKSFAIAGLQPLLMEIFTISRFNLVFPLFDRPRDAVEKLVPEDLPTFDAH